jgi:hypothetical protein
MEIEFIGDLALSVTETRAGKLLLISRTAKDRIGLLLMQVVEYKGKNSQYLRNQARLLDGLQPLDAIELRSNFSSEWGAIMTQHILGVHEHLDRDDTDVISYTAWRYSTLTSWGEASAARELSLQLKIPVRTVQGRIRIARERGILASPGAGVRFGR